MAEVKTYQLRTPGGFSVACHAYGVASQIYVKAPRPEESTADPEADEPSTWLEAYGRRHQVTNPLSVHLEAVTKFAELYGMGEVMQDPTDSTARGYVFHTTGHTTKEKIMTEKNTDETVTAKAPKVKREPIPEGAIVDGKEISQELVNGWIDSYRTKGEDNARMDWTGIVDAVKENHDVQLPNDNRHPVSTKVQRCFRAIVLNGMQPVPAKPKKEKPAPEVEETDEVVEA